MTRAEFISHKGVRILDLDLRGSKDVDANIAVFRLAQKMATKEPLGSLRLLTDVTDAHYTAEGIKVVKEFSKATTPNIKASAVVGIDGMKKIIVMSLIKLIGRDIQMFDTREQALDWLAAK